MSDAASVVSDGAQSGYENARNTTSNAASRISETVQDVAISSHFAGSPAPSTQSTPIRTEAPLNDLGAQRKSANLYIGNLFFEVTNTSLKEEFSRFGEVKNAKVIYDGRGLSKG